MSENGQILEGVTENATKLVGEVSADLEAGPLLKPPKEPVNPNVVAEKRGVKIYQSNPSIPSENEIKRNRRTRIGDEKKGFLIDNSTGEIIGHGGSVAYEWEEVDKGRFVKLYLAGLKQATGLSKAGLSVFEQVYSRMGENPGKDTVLLDALSSGLEPRTYNRGLRDLLDREFLYRSTNPGMFFVNIRYMFNGDRLAFVKGYQLRKDQPSLPGLGIEDRNA